MDELDAQQLSYTKTQAEVVTKIDPVTKAVLNKTKMSEADDDNTLINVHIGNPLRKITQLLEEIKKQKAFSFTLKGSVGIMGVALTLSLLGVFGTTHALCDKGVQTHKGQIKMLKVIDVEHDHLVARIQRVIKYFGTFFSSQENNSPRYRYILESKDNTTIHLNRGRDVAFTPFKDKSVYATGNYNSCSKELTIQTPEAIEEQ